MDTNSSLTDLNLTEAEVQAVLAQISDAISKSKSIMTDLDTQMNKLKRSWTGGAADAYYSVFMRFKKSVAANFESLMNTYKNVYTDSATTLAYNDKALANTVDSSFMHK